MGEKGNVAESLGAAPQAVVAGTVGRISETVTSVVSSTTAEVAQTAQSKVVEHAVDHAIDETRERIRGRRDDAETDGRGTEDPT